MPWFIPLALIGTAAAGTAVAVQGQRQQAKQQKAMANYNAKVEEVRAAEEEQARRFEVGRKRRETRRLMGAQAAAQGASGVLQSGTPLELALDTAETEALNTITVGYNRDVAANRARASAAGYYAAGSAAEAAGRSGVQAALIGGVSQGITGISTYNAGSGDFFKDLGTIVPKRKTT